MFDNSKKLFSFIISRRSAEVYTVNPSKGFESRWLYWRRMKSKRIGIWRYFSNKVLNPENAKA